jgi:predicted DsbA family dithiol-disulfide isomerase
MEKTVEIDFVSDVACPWCAVGLGSLEQAIKNLEGQVKVDIRFQPFELNAHMPKGGQDVVEHLTQKYGISAEQVEVNQKNIRERAAAVGFTFHPEGRGRVYNTFDCHRLLHWALHEVGASAQQRLKKELLTTYFTLAISLDDQQNLLDAVARAELDVSRAKVMLDSDLFAAEVREAEKYYTSLGIHSVPSIIFNQKHLIQGGQSVETFEQAILQLAQ